MSNSNDIIVFVKVLVRLNPKQAEAEVVPSSSLVELELGVRVGA